jgi:hypothetical protein
MVKSNNQEDDDGSVNDSSYLRSGSENQNSQIDYKNASKGPQIKAAIAGTIHESCENNHTSRIRLRYIHRIKMLLLFIQAPLGLLF